MNKWSNNPILLYYDDVPEDDELVPIERTKKYIEKIMASMEELVCTTMNMEIGKIIQ